MLNIRHLPRQLRYDLRGFIVAVRSACKTYHLIQIALLLAVLSLACIVFAGTYINFNRSNLPDLDGFICFQPPTMGHVYDAKGHVLAELGRERREVIQYEDIPVVLREAILSAEDKNFFTHSGVDYSVLPGMLSKSNILALTCQDKTRS